MKSSFRYPQFFRPLIQLSPLLVAGCLQTAPTPPDQSSFAGIERRSTRLLKDEVRNAEESSALSAKQIVTIEGNDILLPEATPDQISLPQSYYFDVAAQDPDGRSMRDLLEKKILRIETVGADATLEDPLPPTPTNPTTTTPAPAPSSLPINTGRARLKVTTKDGVLTPFTIRAWYQGKLDAPDYALWSATRTVKVYYGDIRTRVQIVSRTEAEGMFGKTFAQHFYVGRVFLRNRSASKSLAVYTTSMRVPVLFYRKTDLPGGLTPVAAEQLEQMAKNRWEDKRIPEAQFAKEAKTLVNEFVDKRDLFASGKDTPSQPDAVRFTVEEKAALETRVLAEWARLSDQQKERASNAKKLTKDEESLLIDAALRETIHREPEQLQEAARRSASGLLVGRPKALFTSDGQDLVLRVWSLREQLEQSAKEQMSTAERQIKLLTSEFPTPPAGDEQAKRYEKIQQALTSLAQLLSTQETKESYAPRQELARSEPKKTLLTDIDGVIDTANRETFRRAALALPVHVDRYTNAKALLAYLTDLTKNPSAPAPQAVNQSVREEIADLKERALWGQKSDGRDKNPAKPLVNLGAQSLALSPNPHLQRQLLESGYVWRDAYRPMTFQAVLNSVMFTHANDPKTVTVKVLEALATVAGGAIGLSGSPGSSTLRATNFFSSVLVPTLRATLVEDLNKYITNLGEMAMDTVIIIPPNDSVDRYVFFPRDAIYNFPDEYDSTTPGYIRGIESDELFVEAVPVNSNQMVRGGSVDANTLVNRALNEGERSESARLLNVAQTQAKARTVELGNLLARIDSVMAAADQGTEEEKKSKLARARDEVRKMTAAFIAYFGPDQSGALAASATKHGIALQDAEPVAFPGNTLKLPAGTTSVLWPLNVTDVDTPIKSLTFAQKADATVESWLEAVSFNVADAQRAKAVFKTKKVALPKSDDLPEPEHKEVTLTVADLGGNVVGFKQPIELVPLKINAPVLTLQDEAAKSLGDKPGKLEYTAKIGRKKATLDVSVPLYDADASLYKLAMPAAAEGTVSYIESFKAENKTAGILTASLHLDTSTAAKDAANSKLTLFVVPNSTAATSDAAALTAAALAQVTLTLDLKVP